MSDEITPVAAPAAAPAPTADAAAQPLLNYKEVVELRKETRETRDLLKQLLEKGGRPETAPVAATPAPKDPPKGDELTTRFQALEGELATMRRDGALKDAFLEHGITDPDLRDLLKSVASNANPTDVAAIVAKYAGKLKPAAPQSTSTTEAAKQAVTPGTTNTGAAGGEARTQIPNDILAVPAETWKQLTPEEQRRRYEADKRDKGGNFNPVAERRRAQAKKP